MTLSTIQAVVAAIQADLAALEGVRFAPPLPPGTAGDFPFVTTYPAALEVQLNTGECFRTQWDVIVELHVGRQDLAEGAASALGLAEALLGCVVGTLNANTVRFGHISGAFGAMAWGGAPTLGFRLTVRGVALITGLE